MATFCKRIKKDLVTVKLAHTNQRIQKYQSIENNESQVKTEIKQEDLEQNEQ